MDLLLINILSTKRDFIINRCIKNDVAVYNADNALEVHKILSNIDITHIFIDIVSKTVDWLHFLKELKQSEDGSKFQIIVMSNNTEKNFVRSLLYLGIVGFIRSDLNMELTFDRLDKIMQISSKRDKRRKHFRVRIPNQDKVSINFKVPKSDYLITGKVTDISIVALAFELDKHEDHQQISEGVTIGNVQIKINNKFALVNFKIIKANPISVCAFTHLSDNALNLLTNYIFVSMNKVISNDSEQEK